MKAADPEHEPHGLRDRLERDAVFEHIPCQAVGATLVSFQPTAANMPTNVMVTGPRVL